MIVQTQVRKKYRKLSRKQLLEKVYELGFDFERNSESCSQSTVASLHELLDMDDVIVKVATSSCAGQAARIVGTCGALVGGTMVLDYFFGRSVENMSHKERKEANLDPLADALGVANVLCDRYVREYGTIICPQIQIQLYGRHYYLLDPEEMEKFNAAGGHSDLEKSCCVIVGNAARWVMEILLDKEIIEH